MKKMKLLGIFALVVSLFQCASIKIEKNPPFNILSAEYNDWVGGMPGSSGINITLIYESDIQIAFDNIYFKTNSGRLKKQTNKGNKSIFATINTSLVSSKEDLVLHKEGKKEYGNKLPKKKIPFELKENEAIISYKEEGKTKYYKVENIKKGKTVYYPSAKPN